MITVTNAEELPAGEYAIVEFLGHTTLVGRISEVERFGTRMMAIEPLFGCWLLDPVFQEGSSIYRLTPCTATAAWNGRPTDSWQLTPTIRTALLTELATRLRAAEVAASSIKHPTGSERFAAELAKLGIPAPWTLCDEVPGEILAANKAIACTALDACNAAPDEHLIEVAMRIVCAINTLARRGVE